jgi:hypothetical protein
VFAVVGIAGMVGYVVVSLIGLALWCTIGWFLASRPLIAKVLSRCGHQILPVVLITIGLVVLIEGGAFGLWPLPTTVQTTAALSHPRLTRVVTSSDGDPDERDDDAARAGEE